VDTILIVGVDSVVGANLAATVSDKYRVVGLTISSDIAGIDGCEIAACPGTSLESMRHCVATTQPNWIVHCGPASHSAWQGETEHKLSSIDVTAAGQWARIAGELGIQFSLVSSDAALTGPWMFHTEESVSYCSSQAATTVRAIEDKVFEQNPDAQVIRTNAYGWSPQSGSAGWIEGILAALENEKHEHFDCLGHATPILATDLAEILEQGYRAKLQGLFHAAGAERTNRTQFVARLAELFELPSQHSETVESPAHPASGFGAGETSLQSTKIRKALGIALPMLGEGLARLLGQQADGYQERLIHAAPQLNDRVA